VGVPKNAAIVMGFAVSRSMIGNNRVADAAKEEEGQVLDRDLENIT
jgi:hypothetical protein